MLQDSERVRGGLESRPVNLKYYVFHPYMVLLIYPVGKTDSSHTRGT